ncbi:MAG TPA: hypothetical protein VIK89_11150, partial [Cytophagaceae bacterium]
MNKITTIIIIAIISSLFSCSKDEIIGSEIVSISGPVNILDSLKVSDDTIDFALGERPYFLAKFENEAYWEITLSSGNAYKTLTGGSKEISAINSMWDGSSDAVFSFKPGTVHVTLSFPRSSNKPLLSTSFYMSSKPNLNSNGLLVTDFSQSLITSPDSPTGWASDWQPTEQYDGTGTPPVGGGPMGKFPVLDLIDGTPALVMAGQPWGQGPYVDFIDFPSRSFNTSWLTFPLLSEPNRVYFNMFMY